MIGSPSKNNDLLLSAENRQFLTKVARHMMWIGHDSMVCPKSFSSRAASSDLRELETSNRRIPQMCGTTDIKPPRDNIIKHNIKDYNFNNLIVCPRSRLRDKRIQFAHIQLIKLKTCTYTHLSGFVSYKEGIHFIP